MQRVSVGSAHGRIALYLDYEEAWEMVHAFPPPDLAGVEMMQAIQEAYPQRCHDEGCCDPNVCVKGDHGVPEV